MHAFIALVRKDLILYFSNRRALLMSVVAPIVIAAFFGSLFGDDGGKKPSRIPVAIVDLDQSQIAAKIVAGMKGDAAFDVSEIPESEALQRVQAGKVRAMLVIPRSFGDAGARALFGGGEKPTIAIHYDPSQAIAMTVVRGLLSQHVMESVSAAVVSGPYATKFVDDARQRVAQSQGMADGERRDMLALFDSVKRVQERPGKAADAGSASAPGPAGSVASGAAPRFTLPYATQEDAVTSGIDRKYNSYAHSFAGMSVQFILFMGIDLGTGVLLARRLGLWKRLRAAPLARGILLGSRIASGALIALVLVAIIFAAAIAFFGVRIDGSVIGFVGVCAAFALLTASFGLLIAALGKTPEATRGLAIFVTLVMVMLGGAWVPSFIFLEWLQSISLFVPTRWAVDGLDAMTWRGLDTAAALPPIGVLLAVSSLFTALAIWRFDWQET